MVKSFAALSGDPGSIPGTTLWRLTVARDSSSRGSDATVDSCTYVVHIYALSHTQYTHTHKINIFKKLSLHI